MKNKYIYMINYQCINKTTMEQTKSDEVKVEEIFSECRKTDLSDTEKEQIVIKNKIFIERNKTASCLQLTAKLMHLHKNPQTFYPQRFESISSLKPELDDGTQFYNTECSELREFLKIVKNSPIKFKIVDELWHKSHVYSIYFTKNKHDKTITYELH
jgi:hypothetical protein